MSLSEQLVGRRYEVISLYRIGKSPESEKRSLARLQQRLSIQQVARSVLESRIDRFRGSPRCVIGRGDAPQKEGLTLGKAPYVVVR